MDKRTLKITTGAAVIAIFAVLLLLNRQTGNLFQEVFMFLFPIPMVAFTAKYGWKSGIPVLISMTLISILFGTITIIFYAFTEALIGLVFGDCIHRKVEQTKTLITVMLLSAIVSVLNTIVLAQLFGMDLNQQIAEVQTMMNEIFSKSGIVVPENMLEENFLKQIMIVAMVFLGAAEGFIIYEISLLILRRLQFQIPRPKSIYLYFPPKWTAAAALAAFILYFYSMMKPMDNEQLRSLFQTLGVCGNIYLMCFGFLGIMFYVRIARQSTRLLGIIFCVCAYFSFPMLVMAAGVIYIMTDHHKRTMQEKHMMEA